MCMMNCKLDSDIGFLLSTLQIPDEIRVFIENMVVHFKTISEIWLLGSRANQTSHPNSDWDLLFFADWKTTIAIRKNIDIKREVHRLNIDLLVVYDNNQFRAPWSTIDSRGKNIWKEGKLSEWKFSRNEYLPNIALYKGNYDSYKAFRIWTREIGWIVLKNEKQQ